MSTDKEAFENEVFFSLRKQRNTAHWIAIISLALAVISMLAFISLFPLKETQPFVLMVDKTTGEAEKIVQVRPTSLAEEEAVLQAELVSYVIDRETYDVQDNSNRIFAVLSKSVSQAEDGLRALWRSENAEYPPSVYGNEVRITVKIKNVTPLVGTEIARVRFTKTRERRGDLPVTRSFVATVGYEFNPTKVRNLEELWKNPLGFTVVSYRVDAETLQTTN